MKEGDRRHMRLLLALFAGLMLAGALDACAGSGGPSRPPASGSTAASGDHGAGGSAGAREAGERSGVTVETSTIPPGQAVRGDSDADNPTDKDGNGDIDTRTTPSDPYTSDADNDGPTRESYRYPDGDDRPVLAYGRAPSASERRAIAAVVMRYFNSGSLGDGVTVCSLVYPSLSASIAEDYGRGGPSYLRASSCAGVMDKLFEHYRSWLAAPVRVMAVRVGAGTAEAVVASRTMPASELPLRRAAGRWTIGQLFSQLMP
jgi:hypothetical protein